MSTPRSKPDDNFILTKLYNCVIATPTQPGHGIDVKAFSKAAKWVDKKAVIDTNMARLWGAIFVIGLPDDLKALSASPETERKRDEMITQMGRNILLLPPGAVDWIKYGEAGMSSAALFKICSSVLVPGFEADREAFPSDTDDLRRCLLLLEAVPEFKTRLTRLEYSSRIPAPQHWLNFAKGWEQLQATLDDECPNWREGLSEPTPKTSLALAKMKGQRPKPPTP